MNCVLYCFLCFCLFFFFLKKFKKLKLKYFYCKKKNVASLVLETDLNKWVNTTFIDEVLPKGYAICLEVMIMPQKEAVNWNVILKNQFQSSHELIHEHKGKVVERIPKHIFPIHNKNHVNEI